MPNTIHANCVTAALKCKSTAIGITALICITALSSCSPVKTPKQEPSSHTSASSINLVDAQSYGHAVAAWQLEAFHDLSYLPTFIADSYYARGWIKGSFYIGMERFASTTNDENMLRTIERMARENGFDLGRQPWPADDQAIAAVYGKVATKLGQPELVKPVLEKFDAILENRATNSLEFVQGNGSEGSCQRRWCWADALFMGPPSWAEMTRVTGNDKYLQYAVEETKATISYLFDEKLGLFYRDSRYFDKTTENGEKVFWSRGNGWVFAGLARFIEVLPKHHPDRKYFIDVFRKMANAHIQIQRRDGYWPTSLLDDSLFPNPETSGTGFFGFGLSWGLNNNILIGEEYETAMQKTWTAMTNAVNKNGRLGWVQQVGKDPKSTTQDSSQIYGSGAFLLFASEMIKHK